MTIILAVGKLLSGENTENNGDTYPGSSLFEFVHTRLPTPSEQHAQGRVAIETLTLLGVYLQAMNRKEEAYIYVRFSSSVLDFVNLKDDHLDQHSFAACCNTRLPPPFGGDTNISV